MSTQPTPDELFTSTYVQYRAMVRWTIVGKLGRPDYDLADDLTQETFERLFRYRERIEFGPRIGGLLRVMAGQAIGRHYRVMRNIRETPMDTGDWSFANRSFALTASGAYQSVSVEETAANWQVCPECRGALTPNHQCPAATAHQGDSDPDADELLRRARQTRRPRVLAGAR